MTIPDGVIREAVERYDRERDRYLKLAARVSDIARAEIVEANAIRAQVTSRAKSVRSFENKLRRFNKRSDKDLDTVEKIFSQIGDFAGVRVATYRTEDETRIVKEIGRRFCGPKGSSVAAESKDKLTQGGFYRATHCQIYLIDDELVGTYENLRGTSCEVQVCSMMAHVWNEVEHDIGYKPEGGGPEETESGLLKALGHLTRGGDEVISRLIEANLGRLQNLTGDFEDVFDFVARLRNAFPDADLSVHSGQLFDETQALGFTSPEKLKSSIGQDGFSADVAKPKIVQFNEFLIQNGGSDYLLDETSADLILILLLEKHARTIEANHPAGRGRGRPPRIRSIATRYREYVSGQ
jgi:ppGpp synthetase/RelA/SpoT-type nucleotidyltranferase